MGLRTWLGLKKKRIAVIPPVAIYGDITSYFAGKKGLEIGGPSPIFDPDGYLPLYKDVGSLDGVNFSASTVWTGRVDETKGFFAGGRRTGELFIADATDLRAIPDESYDFVLSSNNIEHIANPLRAVEQWLAKLKNGGVLLVVAPRKESNFDHRRDVTAFSHLLEDYRSGIGEEDLTHLEEILALHDQALDLASGTPEQFLARSLKNIENRCLHQHVFDQAVLAQVCGHFGLRIVAAGQTHSDYAVVAQKQ